MRLTITPVAAKDDEAIDAWCSIFNACRDRDAPRWRSMVPEIARGWFSVDLPGMLTEGYLASVGGQAVGSLRLIGYTEENLDLLEVDIRVVPDARRHGFGRQLHDFARQRAQQLGRGRLVGTTLWELPGMPADDLAGVRFMEALGYKEALVDASRRLDLSTVDEGSLDGMLEEARAKSLGYRLVQWDREIPERYLGDLAYLETRLFTDAPMGELEIEPPKPDPDRMRRYHQIMLERGRVPYNTGAIHEGTDRLVAWTTIAYDVGLDWNVFQQITVVDPEHRGHRLGALVKVENLRYLRAALPTVTAVDTFNADANSYMISINERMGFQPLYAFQNWQRGI